MKYYSTFTILFSLFWFKWECIKIYLTVKFVLKQVLVSYLFRKTLSYVITNGKLDDGVRTHHGYAGLYYSGFLYG